MALGFNRSLIEILDFDEGDKTEAALIDRS